MTEEKPKGVDWVLEQLEKISEAMIPSKTCISCKECPEKEFENCIKGMGIAISELAFMMVRVIQHVNNLYEVLGNLVADPEKLKELKENGYQSFYS